MKAVNVNGLKEVLETITYIVLIGLQKDTNTSTLKGVSVLHYSLRVLWCILGMRAVARSVCEGYILCWVFSFLHLLPPPSS